MEGKLYLVHDKTEYENNENLEEQFSETEKDHGYLEFVITSSIGIGVGLAIKEALEFLIDYFN